MPARLSSQENWEEFDAEGLFPPPKLHTNKLTKIDKVDLKKASRGGRGEPQESPSSEEPAAPQDGDSVVDADPEKGHADELFEMEGGPAGASDEREVRADKEEDCRTEEPEPELAAPEAKEAEGADKPEQKESEGVEEVAEATSKTSEDVHGGDEATKDIADSPNAADDGQNPDNQGAEAGESGESGKGSDGQGESPEAEADSEAAEEAADEGQPSEGAGQNPGGGKDGEQAEGENPHGADPCAREDWEEAADQSVWSQKFDDQLVKLAQLPKVKPASAAGGGAGVDYSGLEWDNQRMQVVFFKTRELINKLLQEEDFTRRQSGSQRWWAKQLADEAVKFHHSRLPSAKFERPKDNNLVFFMDVSGSVSNLAELFMAIMGGAAGLPGVRIVCGSEAHAEDEIIVDRPFQTAEKAINFFRTSVNAHVCDDPLCPSCKGKIRHTGWHRPYDNPFEPGVVEYLRAHNLYNSSTTCVFFGDMQGVHFNVPELRRINRTCKCLWLFTDEPGYYTHAGDLPKAIEARMPIVYNVRTAQTFVQAVRRLQSLRPGLQINIRPNSA